MDIDIIKQQLEKFLLLFIPFFGDALSDMTPEEKRKFLLDLVEAIAAGAARGLKEKVGDKL